MIIHKDDICSVLKHNDNKYEICTPDGYRINPYPTLEFQKGSPSINGINGFTFEAVLSCCIDRLEAFNKGEYYCDYNEDAINFMKEARDSLKKRIEQRKSDGTYEG